MLVYTPQPLPVVSYIAQTYNCDTYGAADYNECPDSSTMSNSDTTQAQTHTDALPTTETSPSLTDPNQAAEQTTQETFSPSTTGSSIVDTVADSSWGVLIPISIFVGVIIALIVLLIRRLRRRRQG